MCPMYEFQCIQCEEIKEEIKTIGTIYINCPYCKNGMMKKIMSMSNWSLKGSGWYRTVNPTTKKCNNKKYQ